MPRLQADDGVALVSLLFLLRRAKAQPGEAAILE
jgi:hypothetical protein